MTKNDLVFQSNLATTTKDVAQNDLDPEIMAVDKERPAEGGEVVQEQEREGVDEDRGARLPRERPFSAEQLVRRAHCGLGHIGKDRLARILQQLELGKRSSTTPRPCTVMSAFDIAILPHHEQLRHQKNYGQTKSLELTRSTCPA